MFGDFFFNHNSIPLHLFLPPPVGVIQECEGAVWHGVDRLTQQPVFVLKTTNRKKKEKDTDRRSSEVQTKSRFHAGCDTPSVPCPHLPRFVEAAVSGGLHVVELLLVLRRRRPRGVRRRWRQHDEKGMLGASVIQEAERTVQLKRGQKRLLCQYST